MEEEKSVFDRAKRILFGAPRDLFDPKIFHNVSLIAFFAWVGLGADGISSLCYGPEEARPHADRCGIRAEGLVTERKSGETGAPE